MKNIQDVMSPSTLNVKLFSVSSTEELPALPDRGVGEGEDPGGEVPGDGGVAEVGESRHCSTGRIISYLN